MILLITTLAVWRAALLITSSEEEGPFELFAKIRDRIDPEQKTWIGRGIRCLWCVSWWAGLVAALWLWAFGQLADWEVPLWWFGTSGGAVALNQLLTVRRR